MIAVIQRVSQSSVTVEGKPIGHINNGLMVLLGVAQGDDHKDVAYLADKIIHLRIFEDERHKMNRSLVDTGGQMLVVSQFTLLGDCRKGRRPSFIKAAAPQKAEELYQMFIHQIQQKGITVAEGQFGAMMDVALVNRGPVTLIIESRK